MKTKQIILLILPDIAQLLLIETSPTHLPGALQELGRRSAITVRSCVKNRNAWGPGQVGEHPTNLQRKFIGGRLAIWGNKTSIQTG